MNTDLQNNVVGFSRTACRIGELLAAQTGIERNNAVDAAQWLLPLPMGRGEPETSAGLRNPDYYDAQIRKLAAAALRCPEALDLVTRWNAVTTPHEEPLRYLIRWITAPAG